MADKDIHSTGRGGVGNIGHDGLVYTAGDIVREGPEGASGRVQDGDYSAGRGGAGNMVHTPKSGTPEPGAQKTRLSQDVVPKQAERDNPYEDFHTGRGGQGNVHRDKYGGHSTAQEQKKAHPVEGHKEHHEKESLVDKAKHAVGLGKK